MIGEIMKDHVTCEGAEIVIIYRGIIKIMFALLTRASELTDTIYHEYY